MSAKHTLASHWKFLGQPSQIIAVRVDGVRVTATFGHNVKPWTVSRGVGAKYEWLPDNQYKRVIRTFKTQRAAMAAADKHWPLQRAAISKATLPSTGK